jgi:deoxyribose-phosphate aldolase
MTDQPDHLEPTQIARRIDHTLLKPDATREQVSALCTEAREHGFASVCVNPARVALAATEVAGCEVAVCSVAGFPLGASRSVIKAAEARQAVDDGATEIDMVLAVGSLLDGDEATVAADIAAVVAACEDAALVKVIIETCLLTDAQKARACELSEQAGASFVKTSTGFAGLGATVEDVRLMRQAVSPAMRVKAAGGIADFATAAAMIRAGADRIGSSRSVAIITGNDR